MNNTNNLNTQHGEIMHKMGLEHGRFLAFSEIISMLLDSDATGVDSNGLDAVRAIMAMQKAEQATELKGEGSE